MRLAAWLCLLVVVSSIVFTRFYVYFAVLFKLFYLLLNFVSKSSLKQKKNTTRHQRHQRQQQQRRTTGDRVKQRQHLVSSLFYYTHLDSYFSCAVVKHYCATVSADFSSSFLPFVFRFFFCAHECECVRGRQR